MPCSVATCINSTAVHMSPQKKKKALMVGLFPFSWNAKNSKGNYLRKEKKCCQLESTRDKLLNMTKLKRQPPVPWCAGPCVMYYVRSKDDQKELRRTSLNKRTYCSQRFLTFIYNAYILNKGTSNRGQKFVRRRVRSGRRAGKLAENSANCHFSVSWGSDVENRKTSSPSFITYILYAQGILTYFVCLLD